MTEYCVGPTSSYVIDSFFNDYFHYWILFWGDLTALSFSHSHTGKRERLSLVYEIDDLSRYLGLMVGVTSCSNKIWETYSVAHQIKSDDSAAELGSWFDLANNRTSPTAYTSETVYWGSFWNSCHSFWYCYDNHLQIWLIPAKLYYHILSQTDGLTLEWFLINTHAQFHSEPPF